MAQSFIPAAATIPTGPLNLRASISQIARHCALSNRPMKRRSVTVRLKPPRISSRQPGFVGELATPSASRRLQMRGSDSEVNSSEPPGLDDRKEDAYGD